MATSTPDNESDNTPDHEPTASSETVAQDQDFNATTAAMSNTADAGRSELTTLSEAFARHQVSRSATAATSRQRQGRNLLLDFPAEIINQIYANCKIIQVDIAYEKQPGGFEGLLTDVHRNITQAFPDIYYTENMFLLDIRQEFQLHGRNKLDKIWKPWLAKLDERYARMIQNFRILTPAFSAMMHIPMNRNEDVTVRFQGYDRRSATGVQVDRLIVEFNKRLQRFNARLAGQRLTKADLDLLIKAIVSTVPFCCRDAGESHNFCSSRPESGELPEGCFCERCQRLLDRRD